MESAILERRTLNVEVCNVDANALLVGVLGLENVIDFHDLEGATVFPSDRRRFLCVVLNRLSRKVGSDLDVVEAHKGGEGDDQTKLFPKF